MIKNLGGLKLCCFLKKITIYFVRNISEKYSSFLRKWRANMGKENCIISLQGVSKVFDGVTVVDDINLDITKGEFVTFLGPSGCGKTTTLRMIAGFETPDKGTIYLNGQDVTKVPPYKRPINTVFQRYALFPYYDVYDNVAFGLKIKKIPYEVVDKKGNKKIKLRKLTNKEIDEKVSRALRIVDLEELEDRDISTLSGGQQQRVAIARAIVNNPQILLLDEPLGALDLKMRKEMQLELKEMHKKLGITFIYVTHDQEEALTMSDTIVVMSDGHIQQIGTPIKIYNEPKNAFVADFIGESNIYNGTMIGKKTVRFLNHDFKCLDDYQMNEKVDVVVRPEDVSVTKPTKGQLSGVISTKVFKGVNYQYTMMIGKNELLVKSTIDYPLNDEVGLKIMPDGIHIMKKDFQTNIYTDAYINNQNQVMIDEQPFECDVTQLIAGSKLDDEGYLIVNKTKKKYDLKNADVVAEVDIDKINIVDDIASDECQCVGQIVDLVYIGDHYRAIIRTEDEEDFVLNTPYSYNLHDRVGIHIKSEDIRLRLKKEVSEYEI